MFSIPILSILVFLPIFAIFIILAIRENKFIGNNVRYIAISTSVVHFIFTLYLFFNFNTIDTNYQFVEKLALFSAIDFNYYLGLDGISLLFLLVSSFLFLIIFSFIPLPVKNIRLYFISFLAILSFSSVTFLSVDLILFYIFYEASIIPVFFLMGIFGGANKLYSTFKFMLYSIAGSMLMIIAIIAMVTIAKSSSIDYLNTFAFDYNTQLYLFLAIFIALAIKVALFPFHSWLPDTYDTAPLSLNIILTGVLMKYGIYGMIRILVLMFPLATFDLSTIVYILSLITLVYSGFIAFSESNMKRLFAYLSISHVALIVAAIFSTNTQGLEGAVFQAVSHSIYNAGIFLSLVYLKQKLNSDNKDYFSGLATVTPILSIYIIIFGLALIGMPLTNGFIGEILSLFAIFQNNRLFAIFFSFAILINAIIIIRFNRYVIFGNVSKYTKFFTDINYKEILSLTLIAFIIIGMGIYPNILLNVMHSSVDHMMDIFKNGIIIKNDI